MRSQFTFYASFFSALSRIKKAADRASAYDAICKYALCGEAPDLESLPDAAAIAFDLIQPTLDASRRKSENGKKGGRSKADDKQTDSKPIANRKQTVSENEIENEIEVDGEIENDCYISPHTPRKRNADFRDVK